MSVAEASTNKEQQSMQRYLVDFAASLTGSDARKTRARLLRLTYDLLKSNGSAVGHSVRALAEQIEEKNCSRLVPWVRQCLFAFEARGLAYRTYDESHFLATNSELELDEDTITTILDDAFSASSTPTSEDHEMSEAEAQSHVAAEGASRSVRRVAILGGRGQRRPACSVMDGFRSMECTGAFTAGVRSLLWGKVLSSAKKVRLFEPSAQDSQRAVRMCSVEYNSSGEYLLAASSSGRVQVFKCTMAQHNLRDTWEAARQLPGACAIRDVPSCRPVDVAHWNPGNRNEVGTCSRTSGEIHSFDMKRCGTSTERSKNAPTTVYGHKGGAGQGGVVDFGFGAALNIIVAGTSNGKGVLWDTRSPRAPKMQLAQASGPLCWLQVLASGHTLLTATTHGSVHVWDLRAARAEMSVMRLGGRDNKPLSSMHIDPQLPASDGAGGFCEGALAFPPDHSPLRSYALEPTRQLDLAFAVGSSCVGVLNLLSHKVSHLHVYPDPVVAGAQQHPQGRLAWVGASPLLQHPSLLHARPSSLSSFHLSAPSSPPRASAWADLSPWAPASVIPLPGECWSVGTHPSDPQAALGLDASLCALSFGHGPLL